MPRTKFVLFFFLLTVFWSCKPEPKPTETPNPKTYSEDELLKLNQLKVKNEQTLFDGYAERTGINFRETGTGLRYHIVKDVEGDSAQVDMWAEINFTVKLFTGKVVYSSDESGSYTFLVGHDEVESGVHEGVRLMSIGDKAIFLIPSHLAYGLTGDKNKIPPSSPLIYEIELLNLRARN